MAYQRILVAVDGSETSLLAMHEAVKVAKDHPQSLLHIVYVADEFIVMGEGVPFDFAKYEASVRENAQAILNKMAGLASEAGVAFETHLLEITEYSARVPDKIVQEAIDWQADLIVIGTHGRRGVSHLLLGSVAEGVIRLASVPVLLVRGKK